MTIWSIIFSLDGIGVILLIATALYFAFTGKKNKQKVSWEQFLGVTVPPRQKKRGYQGKGRGKFEERCREIFEGTFKCSFPSVRPEFLKNPSTDRCLEIDGFNSNIKTPLGVGLGFEYDGSQHSSYNKNFHKSEEEFVYQCRKDSWKDKTCKEEGILLIRIPHFVPYIDLEKYILMRLKEEGVKY